MSAPLAMVIVVVVACAAMVASLWIYSYYDPKKRVCELCGARLVPFTSTPTRRRRVEVEEVE